MYSPIAPEKGVSNICKILAPGGEAVINSQPTAIREHEIKGNVIRLDVLGRETTVGEYFKLNPMYYPGGYIFPQMQNGTLYNMSTIRIRKGKPFTQKERLFEPTY